MKRKLHTAGLLLRRYLFDLRALPLWMRLRRDHRWALGIPTSITFDEKICLYQLARAVPAAGVIVEIGSYVGASTSLLAVGASPRQARVFAIDTWRNEGMSPDSFNDTRTRFDKNTAPAESLITPLQGRSQDIAPSFDQPIDLLFIDGDHSYNGCRRDMQDWIPKIRDNGIVAFHDLAWAEGVKQAVTEPIAGHALTPVYRLPNFGWFRVTR